MVVAPHSITRWHTRVMERLRKLDVYPKINEDFFTRTTAGGFITLGSSILMLRRGAPVPVAAYRERADGRHFPRRQATGALPPVCERTIVLDAASTASPPIPAHPCHVI